MVDGPSSAASKRKATAAGKPTGADGNKPEESSSSPAKPSTGSNTGGSSQQSEKHSASASTTQKSSQAGVGGEAQESRATGVSGKAQQSDKGDSAQRGLDAENSQPGSSSQGNSRAELEITKQCEELIESFRRGQAGQAATVMAIASALRGGALEGADSDTVEAAFESYVAQIDEIVQYRNANRPDDSREPSPSRDGPDSETRHRSQTLSKSKGKGRAGRARSNSHSRDNSPDGLGSPSLSEDERPASKKHKQDPTLFAWASRENEVAESSLCPELRETLRLIRNHDYDIKSARSSLRNSVGVPEFPESEWSNVLLGKYVDLNHVLSGQYTLEQDEKTVQKLGLVELTYRTVTPSRVVRTSGDWVTAWQRTTAAVLYVFPHRRAELDSYHAHIFTMFSSILPAHYNRVIDYDRAVRKRAGSINTLLLSDFDKFHDLRDRFISSFGVASDYADEESKKCTSGRRKPRDKEDETCRRWNRGACDAGDAGCKYVHRCSRCGAAEHPFSRCPKNSRGKA